MHKENETTCACGDNTEETCNDLSQFIWFATYELEHNLWASEMI